MDGAAVPGDKKKETVYFNEDNQPKSICKKSADQNPIHDISPEADIRAELKARWSEMKNAQDIAEEVNLSIASLAEDNIEVVKKDNFFSSEVTEAEQEIIQKRVELQRKKFEEFQKRSLERKIRKILSIYEYLSRDEIILALEENSDDEDTVILKFSEPEYLQFLRKKHAQETVTENVMDTEETIAYERLMAKRRTTQRKSATQTQKVMMYTRIHGRLRLDDALKQIENDPTAMETWSKARIRAYKMIHEKPNAYYYRFNAPGEKQRNGPFSEGERRLFFDRIKEVGANGQWGIFSMAIPGRVGYQCSNYYRQMIERGEIQDSNYYIDEKGKAHYLFGKTKNENQGEFEKRRLERIEQINKERERMEKDKDKENQKDYENGMDLSGLDEEGGEDEGGGGDGEREGEGESEGGGEDEERKSVVTIKGNNRRKSGGNQNKKTEKKQERRIERRVEKREGNGNPPLTNGHDADGDGKSKKRRRKYDSDEDDEDGFESLEIINTQSSKWKTTKRTRAMMGEAVDETEEELRLLNPLPGYIDPITLEEVIRPAISPYGHVMGYASWIKCLEQTDSKKNVCPITKKCLTKKDLVLLTHDNIADYVERIVKQ